MKIRRWIDTPAADGTATIMLTVNFHSVKFRLSSRRRCVASHWKTPKKGLPHVGPADAGARATMDDIEATERVIRQVWEEWETRFWEAEDRWAFAEAMAEEVRCRRWPHRFRPKSKPETESVEKFAERFRAEHGGRLSRSWHGQNKAAIVNWMEFSRSTGRTAPAWSDFTLPEFNRFINHLADVEELSDNSIKAYLSHLKGLLEYAEVYRLEVPRDYLRVKYAALGPERLWLTADELERWANYPFADPADRRDSDRFLMACLTALRYSDWHQMAAGPLELFGGQAFRVMQKKTKTPVTVALSAWAEEIWNRHDGRLFDGFTGASRPRFSMRLKELARTVGLTDEFRAVRFRKGQPEATMVPKCDIISPHVARHTFAVNSLLGGMDIYQLKEIMGHDTISSTEVYAKIVPQQRQRSVIDAWRNLRPAA